MKPETFFDNFEVLADAPNGVQKLREMILQLAVRGKLVAQDERDEPASVFLKKEQNAKKIKSAPLINNDEKPFLLPNGWVFARLSEIGKWAIGNGFPTSEQGHEDKSILFCKVSDMNLEGNEKWIQTTQNTIDEDIANRIRARVHPTGTVIFPKIGGAIATNKRRIIIKPTAIDNNCLGIIPYSFCNSEWLYLLLNSMDFTKYQSGTSVPALNQGTLELIITGLPPLAEQHRIVAKVDQLMSLCDELESRQQKKRETRAHLNSAALDRLLAARAPGEFAQGWRRISDNFDLLYDAPENVGKLRQAIFELAIRGKLVKQESNEESALVLLENIKAEREQLIKEKKIKVSDPLPPIEPEDIPFNLPEGWAKERLGNIVIDFQNGISKRKSDIGQPIPVLRLADIKNNQLVDDSLREIKLTEKEVEKYSVYEGDLLIIRVNGSPDIVGRIIPCLINRKWAYCDHLIRMRIPKQHIQQIYLSIYAQTSIAREHIIKKTITTAGQKTINQVGLSLLPVLLPPLEEQRRIIAKVNQLMSLCDELKAGLIRSQADSERMMEAVVGRMLAGGDSN